MSLLARKAVAERKEFDQPPVTVGTALPAQVKKKVRFTHSLEEPWPGSAWDRCYTAHGR